MNKKPSKHKSQFAEALMGVLDDTAFLSRCQWAEILSVSQAAISQWLHDKNLPRPEVLRTILRTIHESNVADTPPVKCFWDMARRHAIEVTPLTLRYGNSIAEYIIIPIREAFDRAISLLSPVDQENTLRVATALCHHRLSGSVMFDDSAVSMMGSLFATLATLPIEKRHSAVKMFTEQWSPITESNIINVNFSMFNGRAICIDHSGAATPVDSLARRDVSSILKNCRAVARGPSQRSRNLAAADPLRNPPTHFADHSSGGYVEHNEDELPDEAAFFNHTADEFKIVIVVNPVHGRYELELLLQDLKGMPLTGATVSSQMKEAQYPSETRVSSGVTRIGSYLSGAVKITLKYLGRQILQIIVNLEKPQPKRAEISNLDQN